MYNFSVFYIEANVVCILVFAILLVYNYFNIDRQEKQIKFDHVLMAFMFYFFIDCIWASIEDGIIPKTRFAVVLTDFLIYLGMALTAFSWLEYALAYEQIPQRNRPRNRLALMFPFILSTFALILHYIIAPQSLFDGNLDPLPAYNIYLCTVPYIYIAIILFYTVRKAWKEKNRSEKRKHLFIGVFPLIVIMGGLVQMLAFPYIPIYCFTCLILMLVFYIQSIELQISLDPLTNLNNRGQLNRYIANPSNLHPEGRLTLAVMLDIDDFKKINDTYGHSEGDNALIIVSESLRRAMGRHGMPSFIGRYGGDEFILIIHPYAKEETDGLISDIRDEISSRSMDEPYTLSIGVGYDELHDEDDSIQECIKRADRNLYIDKKRRNKGR
ncbi:MAG: diguanylate cyclase [Anaerolineaceae bacterium]|nr:diguanylate cyclase [Anaerolineaceae bacterium]